MLGVASGFGQGALRQAQCRGRNSRGMMSYRAEYGSLLEDIAKEADVIALKYFRADGMRVDRKSDGSAVTQADRAVEEMARAKVTASGLALDVLGEEMGGTQGKPPISAKARLIIDPIDRTEEFSPGIQTFGTLLAIERDGEIVAERVCAPGGSGGGGGERRTGGSTAGETY